VKSELHRNSLNLKRWWNIKTFEMAILTFSSPASFSESEWSAAERCETAGYRYFSVVFNEINLDLDSPSTAHSYFLHYAIN
jgi:hypothetical protein